MPAKSKKQFRLMAAIEHGAHIPSVNISKKKAAEFTHGVNYGHLKACTPFTDEEMNCGFKRLG